MGSRIQSVAIVGGGPAGSALGAALAGAGVRVAIFDPGRRPPLIVGESLIPAIIPFLRDLGIEEKVKAFSVYKPGATFWLPACGEIPFTFGMAEGRLPDYAYNTPRDLFDRELLEAARRAGAKVIDRVARLEKAGGGGEVRLDAESLAAAAEPLGGAPDFIVDATGRARILSRLLEIPAIEGGRRDTALFAHLDRAALARPGDIHVDRLHRGWAWRIPLPGRVSVGVVVDPKALPEGASNEEIYDAFVRAEPRLAPLADVASRKTPVMKYTNYQLVSTRLVGAGWALVGDAAGFVDPIFSTGLFLGLRGAKALAGAILSGTPKALAAFEARHLGELERWKRIISYWYDGRLFTLFRAGQKVKGKPIGRLLDGHMTRHMTRIFSGEAATTFYSRNLLEFMIRNGLAGLNPEEARIL